MAKQKKVMESEIIADDITRDCNSFEAWFIENGKLVAWGCVAIIIAVAVVFSVVQIRKSSQAKAYNTLASAVTEQQIQDALKQYPSGSVAAEARSVSPDFTSKRRTAKRPLNSSLLLRRTNTRLRSPKAAPFSTQVIFMRTTARPKRRLPSMKKPLPIFLFPKTPVWKVTMPPAVCSLF